MGVVPCPSNIDLQRKEAPIDAASLAKLGELLNQSDKWKMVAQHLGYAIHIDEWQKKPNPTKMMIKFAEVCYDCHS